MQKYATNFIYLCINFKFFSILAIELLRDVIYGYVTLFLVTSKHGRYIVPLVFAFRSVMAGYYLALIFLQGFVGVLCALFVFLICYLSELCFLWFLAEFHCCFPSRLMWLMPLVISIALALLLWMWLLLFVKFVLLLV